MKHLNLRPKIIRDARGTLSWKELGRALIADVSGSQLSATAFQTRINMEDELDFVLTNYRDRYTMNWFQLLHNLHDELVSA